MPPAKIGLVTTPGGSATTPGGRKVGFNHDSDDEAEDDGDPLGIARVRTLGCMLYDIAYADPSCLNRVRSLVMKL